MALLDIFKASYSWLRDRLGKLFQLPIQEDPIYFELPNSKFVPPSTRNLYDIAIRELIESSFKPFKSKLLDGEEQWRQDSKSNLDFRKTESFYKSMVEEFPQWNQEKIDQITQAFESTSEESIGFQTFNALLRSMRHQSNIIDRRAHFRQIDEDLESGTIDFMEFCTIMYHLETSEPGMQPDDLRILYMSEKAVAWELESFDVREQLEAGLF